jgi:hypothetical protein
VVTGKGLLKREVLFLAIVSRVFSWTIIEISVRIYVSGSSVLTVFSIKPTKNSRFCLVPLLLVGPFYVKSRLFSINFRG